MSQTLGERVSHDYIANTYDRVTGGRARTRPMDDILDWAESRKDLFGIDDEGYFCELVEVKP